MKLILSCEHASNRVPSEYRDLFAGAETSLASHRGWDPGALELARELQRRYTAPLFQTDATRLLVETNRSIGHRNLFSEYTQRLTEDLKREILAKYYFPHRRLVQRRIEEEIKQGNAVVHVSVHTFVHELNGLIRTADIGLLYDPSRDRETAFCRQWQSTLGEKRSDLKVRRNYPYLGIADGFTTWLRRKLPNDKYLGIELEVNHRHYGAMSNWQQLCEDVSESLPYGKTSL